jgi:hypothetical protein
VVERVLGKNEVTGSNPVGSSTRVWMNGKSIGCNPLDPSSILGSRST